MHDRHQCSHCYRIADFIVEVNNYNGTILCERCAKLKGVKNNGKEADRKEADRKEADRKEADRKSR